MAGARAQAAAEEAAGLMEIAMADSKDMKDFMPQDAIDASIASAQRIAMAIVAKPKSLRAECLAAVRRALEETAERHAQRLGGARNMETARAWAALQMQGIEALVREIDASGGASGGHA
jgi:hypothetical protein